MSLISRVSRISQRVVDETRKKINTVRESVIETEIKNEVEVGYTKEENLENNSEYSFTPTVETVST